MIIFCKKYFFSTIYLFLILLLSFSSCHKHGAGYNPYLHSNASKKQQKSDKKVHSKALKSYKKEMRKNRKRMFGG